MTNEQVQNGFNEVYNGFWLKLRDRTIPKQSEEWERIQSRAAVLMKQYPFMKELIAELVVELDQRMRRGSE